MLLFRILRERMESLTSVRFQISMTASNTTSCTTGDYTGPPYGKLCSLCSRGRGRCVCVCVCVWCTCTYVPRSQHSLAQYQICILHVLIICTLHTYIYRESIGISMFPLLRRATSGKSGIALMEKSMYLADVIIPQVRIYTCTCTCIILLGKSFPY